jgi:hypothetical protein
MTVAVTGLRGPATPMLTLGRVRLWLRQRRQARVLGQVDARLREDAGLPCGPFVAWQALPGCLPVYAMVGFAEARYSRGQQGRIRP